MGSPEEIRTVVHQFIRTNFIFDEKAELKDDQSLLGSGVIDSTGILELLAFLEETYHLKFQDNELVGENFDSIKKITVFVAQKLTRSQAAK